MSDDGTATFNVSQVTEMTDAELTERHREILRVERREFHETLSNASFLASVGHLQNPALDDARWALEKELRRRGLWPPSESSA